MPKGHRFSKERIACIITTEVPCGKIYRSGDERGLKALLRAHKRRCVVCRNSPLINDPIIINSESPAHRHMTHAESVAIMDAVNDNPLYQMTKPVLPNSP